MAHQTKTHHDPRGKCFFFDNFYTRCSLTNLLKKITDNEAHLIGTVKFTNIGAINCIYLQKAIEQLKDAPRETWKLVQAFDKSDDVECQCLHHNTEQKTKPALELTEDI